MFSISLCRVSASGNSASGEMTITKALEFIEEINGVDIIFSIAVEALSRLEAVSNNQVIAILDGHTDGHWVQMP